MKYNEENKSDNYESIKEIKPIIDIPKLIKNKDSKSIQMLTLQSITLDIDLNKIICNEELKNSNTVKPFVQSSHLNDRDPFDFDRGD